MNIKAFIETWRRELPMEPDQNTVKAISRVLDDLEQHIHPPIKEVPTDDGLVEYEVVAREVFKITTTVRAHPGRPEEAIEVYKNGQDHNEEWVHSRNHIMGAIQGANEEIEREDGNTRMEYECDLEDWVHQQKVTANIRGLGPDYEPEFFDVKEKK